jgi:hypothetical protein
MQGISPKFHSFDIVSCGSKISEWFNIQSEGDSLTGIMFCVVFPDHKNNPVVRESPFHFRITCLSQGIHRHVRDRFLNLSRAEGDHVWVFYMSHSQIKETTDCRISFLFDTCYSGLCWSHIPSERTPTPCSCVNSAKRCGARLLYEQDLKQLLLDGTINIFKRSREFCD